MKMILKFNIPDVLTAASLCLLFLVLTSAIGNLLLVLCTLFLHTYTKIYYVEIL